MLAREIGGNEMTPLAQRASAEEPREIASLGGASREAGKKQADDKEPNKKREMPNRQALQVSTAPFLQSSSCSR